MRLECGAALMTGRGVFSSSECNPEFRGGLRLGMDCLRGRVGALVKKKKQKKNKKVGGRREARVDHERGRSIRTIRANMNLKSGILGGEGSVGKGSLLFRLRADECKMVGGGTVSPPPPRGFLPSEMFPEGYETRTVSGRCVIRGAWPGRKNRGRDGMWSPGSPAEFAAGWWRGERCFWRVGGRASFPEVSWMRAAIRGCQGTAAAD